MTRVPVTHPATLEASWDMANALRRSARKVHSSQSQHAGLEFILAGKKGNNMFMGVFVKGRMLRGMRSMYFKQIKVSLVVGNELTPENLRNPINCCL